MGITFRLAWRNIWRSPRRTILTLLAISFAVMVLMFFVALQLRSYDTAIRSTTSLFHGHLQIQVEGYLDRPQMRSVIVDPSRILGMMRADQRISAVSPRALGFAMASSGERTFGVQVIGVDPDREGHVSSIPGMVTEGRWIGSGGASEGAIGSVLARNLRITVGDELTLLGQGRDGSLAAGVVRIVGIFESGAKDLDRGALEIPLEIFDSLFSMEGAVHSLVSRVRDFRELPDIQSSLLDSLAGLQKSDKPLIPLRWDELLPGLKQSILLDMSAGWLFFVSLVVIVAFSVLNTFLMSVLERSREFGVLLALGVRRGALFRLILLEGVMLILCGIVLGIGAGSGIVLYFNMYGFTIPGTDELMKMWHLPGTMYPELNLAVLTRGPLVVLLLSGLALLLPALKARSLKILVALRGE